MPTKHASGGGRPIDRQAIRRIVYVALHSDGTDSLTQAVDILASQIAFEADGSHRDKDQLSWLRNQHQQLTKERQRRWNATWSEKQVDQLEREFGPTLDAMPAEQLQPIVKGLCDLYGYDFRIVNRFPQFLRSALLRYLASEGSLKT